MQFYSAALVIATSSAITNNLLLRSLLTLAPSVDPAGVVDIGPYDLEAHFSGATLRGVREAYMVGLRGSWAMGIAFWGASVLVSLLIRWPGRLIPATETNL
jgi:MFS transporter, DHA2 family, glioxin efflux transporter